MGIRAKTFAVVGLVLLVLGPAVYFTYAAESRHTATEIERAEVANGLLRVKAAMDARIESLTSISGDWAVWDDTYRFVRDQNPAYVASNLQDDALRTLGVDFMIYTDTAGAVVASKAVDPASGKGAAVPAGLLGYLATKPALLRQTGPTDTVSGVLDLQEGPAVIVARPIVTSDMRSPIAGTYITGYFIQGPEVEGLTRLTLLPVSIACVHSPSLDAPAVVARDTLLARASNTVVTPRGPAKVQGYGLVNDLLGKPVLLLKVTMDRTAVNTAEHGMGRSVIAISLVVLGLLITLALVLEVTVLRRLTALSTGVDEVGRKAETSARVDVTGSDEIAHVAGSVNSMLGRLEQSQRDMEYLATHDALTGLHNRRYFEEAMERDVAESSRLGFSGSVLWLDLDHFKEVNDSLGHAVGDDLLTRVAGELQEETRSYGAVARLGGDEFAMLLPHADGEQALTVATRVVEKLASSAFEIDGHPIRAAASVGIVTYPEDGTLAEDLLARADLAMYAAKEGGRNRVSAYTDSGNTQQRMAARIEGAERVVRALQEERLVLYAQPTRKTSDGSDGPCELLLRMVGEDGTIVEPDDFIPTAERLGIIRDIDRWVVRTAIGMLAAEDSAGRDTVFSVNLSGCAFTDSELLGLIRHEFASTGAKPGRLVFEITETAAIKDIQKARAFIDTLRAIGCRFSLDDFGSGMSSFYYLKHLPVDFLKIDGSLVKSLETGDQDAHFIRAIIEMCRGLGIATVAEYVENERLLLLVDDFGVDYVQGYHIAIPQPWNAVTGATEAPRVLSPVAASGTALRLA